MVTELSGPAAMIFPSATTMTAFGVWGRGVPSMSVPPTITFAAALGGGADSEEQENKEKTARRTARDQTHFTLRINP
jgi:hypothetical protein